MTLKNMVFRLLGWKVGKIKLVWNSYFELFVLKKSRPSDSILAEFNSNSNYFEGEAVNFLPVPVQDGWERHNYPIWFARGYRRGVHAKNVKKYHVKTTNTDNGVMTVLRLEFFILKRTQMIIQAPTSNYFYTEMRKIMDQRNMLNRVFFSDALRWLLGFGKDQDLNLLSLDQAQEIYYIEANYLLDINNIVHDMLIYRDELYGVLVDDSISELLCMVPIL